MNLRIAMKIMKRLGTADELRYSRHQIRQAITKYLRTKAMKDMERNSTAVFSRYLTERAIAETSQRLMREMSYSPWAYGFNYGFYHD